MNRPRFDAARRVIERAIEARAFPAAVVDVGRGEGPIWHEAFGRLTWDDEAPHASRDTVFDLASLTKVVATTSVALGLAGRKRLDLDTPLSALVPGWHGADRSGVTVADVLEHASGLTAYLPIYESASTEDEFEHAIVSLPLDYAPRSQAVYSDLGFILMAIGLARDQGQSWAALVADALRPVSLDTALVFRPPPAWRAVTAPTRVSPWRGRLLRGEVDDENAWALGGVAGHAGLFGTASSVAAFAREVLVRVRAAHDLAPFPHVPWLGNGETWRRAVAKSTVAGSSRALGWDTMLPTSSCGTLMAPSAMGHTGFTGTSLWIDWERDVYVVLLTNRVHPDGTAQEIVRVRPALHDAVMTDLLDWGAR